MNSKIPLLLSATLICGGCAQSQNVAPKSVPQPALVTPVALADIDAATFAQWMDGAEKPMAGSERFNKPQWVIWTQQSKAGHSGLKFGESKTPGARHLRVGFKKPVAIGSVLVLGGGTLSVLKNDAVYPGDLNDNQWTPAQRLVNGAPSSAEVGADEYALWTLPPGTETRALRFSHQSSATDASYQGFLGGALVLSERATNLAPLAQVAASSVSQDSDRIANGNSDNWWDAWANRFGNDKLNGARPIVSARDAEWMMLSWAKPVELSGLQLLWAGFESATVQNYVGPADRPPRGAVESDWRDVASFEGINKGFPTLLWPNALDFGRTIQTRAVRLKITAPTDEKAPHMGGKTQEGKRVWLGELMALSPLAKSPLQTVSLGAPADQSHPPIPIRFRLEKPGLVTLVIEKPDGTRVRNLVAETPFPAGDNVAWWDGTDDLGRDTDAANHGVFKIPAQLVTPGTYRVRGLVHDAIVPRYEFSVYSPGTPPWETADKTGGWTTNHTPPQAALYLPASKAPGGKPLIYLGSYVSEGGAGLAWVDENGVKQGGRGWIGGHWTAAPYLGADNGPNAAPGAYAYVASVWSTAKKSDDRELRVNALTDKGDAEILVTRFATQNAGEMADEIRGLAVYNGLIAVSLPRQQKIQFARVKADGKTGKLNGEILGFATLADARGLAFDGRGRLLALVGAELRRYAVSAAGQLSAPQVLVRGLQDPQGLALDEAGRLYVSDWGESHQVKIFDEEGKAIRTLGKAGAPATGVYDPLRLTHPHGMAVDGNGRLWVTENDYLPKRVSVWNADGTLWKAFYGPTKYGGGGTLDPNDKTRFLLAEGSSGTLEFQLDWKTGESKLTKVLVRQSERDMEMPFRATAPELPLARDGRKYLANSYNSSPTNGHSTAMLYIEKNDAAFPVAAMGKASDWPLLGSAPFRANWPAGAKDALFAWSDGNGDGRAQPAEVSYRAAQTVGGVTVAADLSFLVARVNGLALRFAPQSFKQGAPLYDVGQGETLVAGVKNPVSTGGGQVLATGKADWTVVTLGLDPFAPQSLSGAKNGAAQWSYPSLWPGLHASHRAPQPAQPGQLIGTTRLMGDFFTPAGSDVGPLWGINSNVGTPYLFTADGLFVTSLFQDFRQGDSWKMPREQRGLNMDALTLGGENFWPTITQTSDGKVYLVSGRKSSVVTLQGLETLRRLPPSEFKVGARDLEAAQTYILAQEVARQKTRSSGVLKIALGAKAPVVDGQLDDWKNADWVDIDKRGVGAFFDANSRPYDVTGALAVSGDRLFAAYRTGDAGLLKNSGEVPTAPFVTGGALDLMLATNGRADPKRDEPVAGDLRLVVTMVGKKPRAVLYRAVVPGATNSIPFSSPWRTLSFDEVRDVSDQIQLAGTQGNYEFSIPLSILGLKPQPGQSLRGDIGVLRGNGFQTTTRVYWSNKATGIVEDVPSEAMLTPNLWGSIEWANAK